MGVDLDDADRIQISRRNYIVVIGKEEYVCKVKELESTACKGCQFCNDFVSRLADISIGSVGSPDGYSTILVRSDRGKKLIEASDFVRAEADKDDILKLSRLKQKKAERSFAKITDGLAARGGYPLDLST
jgi:coenzyme F420 hydrogenase subunit beta